MCRPIRVVCGVLSLAALVGPSSRLATAEDRVTTSKDGVTIAYRASGKGSPSLVFVHCWSCDKSYWDAQVAHFSKRHRVLAVDLAGHGASGSNRERWTMASLGEDVAAAVLKEKLDKVVLIGHSMGGGVCLEAARILGTRVIAVVGVDTLQDLDMTFPPEQLQAFVAPFETDFPKATEGFVRSMFPPTADPRLIDRIAKDMASAPPSVALPCLRAALTYDGQATLATLHIPIFAVNSDRYPVKTEAVTRHGLTFQVKIMKGYGHFLAQEDPALFDRLLEEVLAELPHGKTATPSAANAVPASPHAP